MSKHTPGPYIVTHDPDAPYDGDGEWYSVFTNHGQGIESELAGKIGERTNAILFAAAPDLLNALKEIADRAHRAANGAGTVKGLTIGDLKREMRMLRDIARAAIIKTEGRP